MSERSIDREKEKGERVSDPLLSFKKGTQRGREEERPHCDRISSALERGGGEGPRSARYGFHREFIITVRNKCRL